MRISAIIGFALCSFAATAFSARADMLNFTAPLASDDAPQSSAAKGNARLSLDTVSKTVNWTIEYSGLSAPAKAVDCGALDATSGPSIQLSSNLASPITGSKTLTDAEIGSLRAGHWVCLIGSADDEAELGGQLQPAR
jgi:hypothetical protein